MYRQLVYIKNQLALRKHMPNNQDDFGSILKHQRKELKMTLEESAEGICSISYLSKVENNLIRPSDKYIDLFEERYKVNLKNSKIDVYDSIAEQIIDSFYYQTELNLDNKYFSGVNYRSKLYNLGYLVSKNNYIEAKNMYIEFSPYIKNLSTKEVPLCLFFISKILSYEGRYKDAFNLLMNFSPKSTNLKVNSIIKKEKLYLSLTVKNHPYISLNYNKIINELIENESYDLVHDLKFRYINYLIPKINHIVLANTLKKTVNLNKLQKDYLLARHDYINMAYEKAYKRILGYEKYNVDYYMLALFIFNKANKREEIQELLKSPVEHLNVDQMNIIEFLNYKHFDQEQKLLEHLKSKVLKYSDLPEKRDDLIFWYEEGLSVFKIYGYYKDATTLSQLIFNKTKDLSCYTN